MSNLVFLQIVNIKFAMHRHASIFWFMFASPVLKRFCCLTRHVDILVLQIVNAIQRKNEWEVKWRRRCKQSEKGTVVMRFLKHSALNQASSFALLRRTYSGIYMYIYWGFFFFHRSNWIRTLKFSNRNPGHPAWFRSTKRSIACRWPGSRVTNQHQSEGVYHLLTRIAPPTERLRNTLT